LDLVVARAFAGPSEEHRRLFECLNKPGTLKLSCQLDLWTMLHPMVQPGAKLDYEYPPETVTVVFKSNARVDLKTASQVRIKQSSSHEMRLTVEPKQNQWLPLDLAIPTGKGQPELDVSWFTAEDPRPRALPLRRFLMPWATPKAPDQVVSGPRSIPELAGGDWDLGKKVFFSEQASCFKCHQVRGEGGKIGPDLSSLLQRDYASVVKDIAEPSAAINPDHLAYNLELRDGGAANGVLLEDTPEKIVLGQVTGQALIIQKNQITSMKASSVSLMPEGLLKGLSPQQQKDLLTYLLMQPK